MNVVMLVLNDMTADARVDREAAALAAAGHRVTVLALNAATLAVHEKRDGFEIHRVAEYTRSGWSRPYRKLAESRRRRAALVDAAVALEPDAIHAHDTDTLQPAAMAADRAGAKLVYDAHELYPDMLEEHGAGGSPPVQWYWKRIERTYIPKADAAITVSRGLADVLAERFAVDPAVVRNVPGLAPLVTGDRLRAELDIPDDRPIVLYQGVLIAGRGLTSLVRAIARVPSATLVVQGFGPQEQAMREAATAHGLNDRVIFMGRVPGDDLHEYACGADVGVVIYEATTLNNRMAAPNKLWSYRMAGLPVVASDLPGLRTNVVGDEVGLVFDPASVDSIATAISDLLADRERLRRMSTRSRELAESRDNWEIEKQKLLAVYERLAAASTS